MLKLIGDRFWEAPTSASDPMQSLNPSESGHSPTLIDQLVGARQHWLRNLYTNLLCSFQVYHEFKLRRLLYGQISRLSSFEDLST